VGYGEVLKLAPSHLGRAETQAHSVLPQSLFSSQPAVLAVHSWFFWFFFLFCFLFAYLFILAVLEFELKASHLLDRHLLLHPTPQFLIGSYYTHFINARAEAWSLKNKND
jgi:hypothetical protein